MMIALAALVLGCSACTNGLAVDGRTAERLKADVSTYQTTSGPGTVYVATDDGVLTSIDLPGGHRNWSVYLPQHYPLPSSISLVQCESEAYILATSAYKGPAALIPFDRKTGAFGSPIRVGLPGDAAVVPNGSTAYVANSGGLEGLPAPTGNTVTPVDLTTGRRLEPIDVGGQPAGIAETPDGKTILVSLVNASSVVPISVASRTAGRPITLTNPVQGENVGGPIAIDAADDIALIANLQMDLGAPANIVNVINLKGLQAESPISLGSDGDSAQQLVVSPSGKSAFALNYLGVRPLDLTTRMAGRIFDGTYRTTSIAMSSNGKSLYLDQLDESSAGSALIPMNPSTGALGPPLARFKGDVSVTAISR